jgi:predicted RNase H-like HicB family nuclease
MSLPALLRTFSIGRLLFEALTRTGSPSALSKEEGGGYLVEYPDIPGCMSDGETEEEAIANGREAKAIGARQVHAEKRR